MKKALLSLIGGVVFLTVMAVRSMAAELFVTRLLCESGGTGNVEIRFNQSLKIKLHNGEPNTTYECVLVCGFSSGGSDATCGTTNSNGKFEATIPDFAPSECPFPLFIASAGSDICIGGWSVE